MEENNKKELTSHEKSELKKQEREAEERARELEKEKKAKQKLTIKILLIVAIVGGIGYFLFTNVNFEKPFTTGPVHWHVKLDMSICNQIRHLPRIPAGMGHLGTPLLHTHDDDIIHVEGQPFKPEDVMLGRFMDAVGVPFDKDRFFEKKNGDICENTGKPGILKMYLNGKETDLFRNYVAKNGDKIKLVFE